MNTNIARVLIQVSAGGRDHHVPHSPAGVQHRCGQPLRAPRKTPMKLWRNRKMAEGCGRLGNDQGPEGVAQARAPHRYSGTSPPGKENQDGATTRAGTGAAGGEAHPAPAGRPPASKKAGCRPPASRLTTCCETGRAPWGVERTRRRLGVEAGLPGNRRRRW